MFGFRRIFRGLGIVPKTTTETTVAGEIDFSTDVNKFNAHNGTTSSPLLTEAHTATVTNKSIDADTNTITNIENADIKAAAAIDASKIANGTVSNTEFQYLDGVTSGIQGQLDGKPSNATLTAHTGASSGVHGVVGSVVGTTDSQTLTNKTLTAPVISTISNTGTLTLPTSTTTLVGNDTTNTLTNKTFDADGTGNSITNIENADIKAAAAIARSKLASGSNNHVIINDGSGVMSSEASLAITRGGTGQATASAAYDALSPNTTKGDITVRNSTTNARLPVGANGTVLTADSAETQGVKWATPTASSLQSITTGQNADLTVSTQATIFVPTANRVATLPTAVGVSGQVYEIIKGDSSVFTVTINTTSSQTIGGRASGSIVLRRLQDNLVVISNGTNWDILDKKEFEVVTSYPGATGLSGTAAGNYLNAGASVSLSYGIWEVTGTFGLNVGTGTSVGLITNSGFYGAAGTNTSTPPTALSGTISGDATYTNMNATYIILPLGATSNSRYMTAPITIRIQVTATTTVHFVPQIDYATAGTSSVTPSVTARRLF